MNPFRHKVFLAAASALLLAAAASAQDLRLKFAEGGFEPVPHQISFSPEGLFPENFTISFGQVPQLSLDGTRETLIIAFTQENAALWYERIENLMLFARKLSPRYRLTFLFSANDDVPLRGGTLQGSRAFSQDIEDPERAAALCVRLSHRISKPRLILGAQNQTSPLWLARLLEGSCRKAGLSCFLPTQYILFYRMGLCRKDVALSSFLENHVAAAGIELPASREGFEVLENLISGFSPEGTGEWNRHYVSWQTAFRTFWADESVLIAAFAMLAVACIGILCGFSFMGGRLRQKDANDFKRTWPLIPAVVIACAVFLGLGQGMARVAEALSGGTLRPLQLGLVKLMSEFVLVQVSLFFLVTRTHLVHSHTSGFLMSLMSLLNLFIFCAVDITLLPLFALEYVVFTAIHHAGKIRLVIPGIAVSSAPFIPYVLNLSALCEPEALRGAIFCSFGANVMISCFMFPLIMLCAKMALRLKVFWLRSRISRRRSLAYMLAFTLACTLFVFAAEVLVSRNFRPAIPAQEIPPVFEAESEGMNATRLSYSDSRIFSQILRTLKIDCAGEPLRYRASVIQEGIPVYDAEFEYSSVTLEDGLVRCEFEIPDMPPSSLSIEYAPDASSKSQILVESWYRAGGKVFHESDSLETDIVDAGGLEASGLETSP